MGHNRSPVIYSLVAFRGQRTTGSYVIEVIELISEVSLDLRGRLDALADVLAEYMAFGGCEKRYRNFAYRKKSPGFPFASGRARGRS